MRFVTPPTTSDCFPFAEEKIRYSPMSDGYCRDNKMAEKLTKTDEK